MLISSLYKLFDLKLSRAVKQLTTHRFIFFIWWKLRNRVIRDWNSNPYLYYAIFLLFNTK